MEHIRLILVVLCVTIAYSIATTTSSRFYPEHDIELKAPFGWSVVEKADDSDYIHLTLGLRQRNLNKLEEFFWQVSDPSNPRYGKYLNNKQLANLIRPAKESIEIVSEWLKKHADGIRSLKISGHSDYLMAEASVEVAEKLFGVSLHKFQHQHSDKIAIRSLRPYSVPMDLAEHIDVVLGLNTFPVENFNVAQSGVSVSSEVASSNSPILSYNMPGSEALTLFLAVKCRDGSFLTSNGNDGQYSCNGEFFTGFSYSLNEPGTTEKPAFIDVKSLTCTPCSAMPNGVFSEKCQNTIKLNSAPANTLFCQFTLKNYVPHDLSISTAFGADSTSAFVYSGTIILSPWVYPQLLQRLYRVPVGIEGHRNNSQCVVEFLKQYYSESDLKQWFQQMGLAYEAVDKVVGPNKPSNPGGEASLDIQFMLGVARNVRTVFWSTAGNNPGTPGQEPFLAWLMALQSDNNPPLVNSVSYGDLENMIHVNYMKKVDVEFMKAGARGLSILFASGDDGCGGYLLRTQPDYCKTTFNPSWPSDSAFVTAVGGTQLLTDQYPWCSTQHKCVDAGEVVSDTATGSRITSGGGFSNVFEMPKYQKAHVEGWYKNSLQANLPPKPFYNANGRAYPDISGMAHNYLVMLAGELIAVDGTSASTPVVSAVVTQLNEIQLRSNKSPLGFLNPWLYSTHLKSPEIVNDVVVGNNKCSANPGNCCEYGFYATPGWDPATGLGTPNYEELKRHLP